MVVVVVLALSRAYWMGCHLRLEDDDGVRRTWEHVTGAIVWKRLAVGE